MREPSPVSDEEPRHIRIYHEDFGDVLWWTRPITEPPYVGSPLCDNWPGYHQWWTPLPPIPRKLLPKWDKEYGRSALSETMGEGGE